MLFYKGQFLENAMRQERVVRSEALQAIRSHGLNSLEDVEAIILETDGSFSVIKQSKGMSNSALYNVQGLREE